MIRQLPAYQVYLIMSGAYALFFATYATISSVYRFETAGLGAFQLVLVGTVLEASVFLFEVPTGVVADVYSRRLSIIIGMLVFGIGFIIEGMIPAFWAILLAQVIWGLGATFLSGARHAWIADELGEAGIGQVFLRGSQVALAGSLAGTFVSVALASYSLSLPLVIAGGLFVGLGLFLLMVMPENHFAPEGRAGRSAVSTTTATLTRGFRTVRGRPVLMTIMALGVLYGMGFEVFDRLWQAHFLTSFSFPSLGRLDDVVWFGIINAGAILLSLVATEFARRRIDTDSHIATARALLVVTGILMACVVGFALAGNFMMALAFYWSSFLLRQMEEPLSIAWLNQGLSSRVRATVISMRGQADAFGQIVGGPLLGLLASLVSIRAGMLAIGLILSPAIILYLRSLRAPEAEPVLDQGDDGES